MLPTHKITELLRAWSKGDSQALDELIPLVDRELKKTARAYMAREKAGHTLQTTALVNEALMRLIKEQKIGWESRKHFYALVAIRMRQVLIDHAKGKSAAKRGGPAEPLNSRDQILSDEASEELKMLDEALRKLTRIDERKAKVVEYRYFGGYTVDEVAQLLDLSEATVEREWRFARSWLKRQITTDSTKTSWTFHKI